MSAEEVVGLLHELEVREEALNIQHEELRRLQRELESAHAQLAGLTDTRSDTAATDILRDRDDAYRRLVDSVPFCICEIERDGTLSAVNPAVLALANLSDESALLGVEFLNRLSEEDWPRIGKLFERAKSGETTYFEVASRSGRFYESCFIPLTGENGIVQRVMGIAQDITERKKAEAGVRLRDHAFESSSNGIVIVDALQDDLPIIYCNPAFERITGYSEAELLGRNCRLLQRDDRNQPGVDAIRAALQAEQEVTATIRNYRKDATMFWSEVRISPVHDSAGRLTHFLGFQNDVTDRKEAELALRESEDRFRNLCSRAPVGIFTGDPCGNCTYINEACSKILGIVPEQVLGSVWHSSIHPDDRQRVVAEWKQTLESGADFSSEHRVQRSDGSVVWVQVEATSRPNDRGELLGFIGTIIDITGRMQAELELAARNKLLESIRTIQSEFVAGANPQTTFDKLLAVLLEITGGEYGFIGEILNDDTGLPYLQTYAVTDIAWDEATRKLYGESALTGLEFRNLESLYGAVITSGRPVISHDPALDPRRGGLPPGHNPLNDFLGLPIYSQQKLIGMAGVANRPAGMGEALPDALEPLLALCANLLEASRNELNRQKTEAALRESEEQYRLITESSFDGVVIVEDGRIVDANRAFERMFGYSIEELRGRTPLVITSPSSGEIALRRIKEGSETPYEIVGVKKDGTQFDVEVLGRNMQRKGRPARVTAMRDITERKRVEQWRRELNERNIAIVSALGEIVYEWRPQDDQFLWQGEFTRILGYRPEELGRDTASWTSRLHPHDLAAVMAEIEAARIGRRMYDIEHRFRAADGQYRWIHNRGMPFVDAEGNLERLIGVFRDVTRRRAQEEELRSLNTSLEERVAERTAALAETNAELDAFAHTVSHDLRAPLRAMEGFATALAEDYGERLDDEGREFIQHISDSAKRMDTLVNDLLAFSRLGRAELRLKKIPLDSIMTESLRQLSSEIEECRAVVDVADHLPMVLGHHATLVQIVTNLLSNAMKFVAPGVRPKIRAWPERGDDGMMRLWIEDNGIGINDAYRDRIFRVFERLHGIESYPGTGIGLAIVARGCERLGGRYGFESQHGEGSRFWVEFQAGRTIPGH